MQRAALRDGREALIRRAGPEDAWGLYLLIDSLARERRWLLNTEAHWGVDGQRQWIVSLERGGGLTLLAEDTEGEVVGWSDLARPNSELAHHTATLGIGVAASYRGVGLGRALLERAVAEARELGVEKLELTVRARNGAAITLYESAGWEREGVSRRAFKQDGEYEDRVHMGLWLGEGQRGALVPGPG